MTPRSPTADRAWRVTPEIVALANEPRHPVRMPLGDGRSQDFRMSAFEAREGFSFDDETGQIIVSEDPTELSYYGTSDLFGGSAGHGWPARESSTQVLDSSKPSPDTRRTRRGLASPGWTCPDLPYWYGQNGRDHLALTVVRGRIAGRVYTPTQRLTFNAFGPEQHYQRIDMGLLNRGRCAHSEIMRRLTGRPAEGQNGRTFDGRRESARHVEPADRESISGAQSWTIPLRQTKPTPTAELTKHQIKIDVIFYFTDVLAEAIDYDNIPEWNYTPGNIAVAEALLAPRVQAYIDEINQSLRNSGSLSHIEFQRKGPLIRLLDQNGNAYNENPLVQEPYGRFAAHLINLQDYENEWIINQSGPPGPRRADHDADLAILLVDDMGNPHESPPLPVFGVAFMQRAGCGEWLTRQCGVGPGFVNGEFGLFGYGVVSAAEETANFTFSHEVGHLLGADHDIPNASIWQNSSQWPVASFAHSFGHRAASVRDIMADPWCGAWQSDTCPRSQQFSNPEVFFIGTSIPAGTVGGRTCANPSLFISPICPLTDAAALTIRKNAQGHANIYPVGSNQTEPDLFWDGLEFFCEPPLCPAW